ncbi:MupA/Atu3671 family FMN-dependent luciferase-like monooxygenase [Xylanibacillus composti]|nr:MupA/Atu3671 family FMN-dependent luciferase-like monooxygenase [Xylanibacillus composti]
MMEFRQAPMAFSLFFFSSDSEAAGGGRYDHLLEIARLADEAGFQAIWTPERHFHRFGGIFPNPAVISAAIAAQTKRIRIRAGSVLLPFHHPIRAAEDWSIVDNLSGGRVDLAVTYGWHPRDYVFAPDVFETRKQVLFDRLETMQRLWRGESLNFPSATGEDTPARIYPQPVQARLPIWITTSRTVETWRKAGEIGANILTALYAIDQRTLSENIAVYRAARAAAGHEGEGTVTAMLHTFIGECMEEVREVVRKPFIEYILRHTELYDEAAVAKALDIDPSLITDKHRRTLASMSFERYIKNSSLIGTLETASTMVASMSAIGVNEIACLIDFGVPHEQVKQSLIWLDRLRMAHGNPDQGKEIRA